MLVVHTVVLLVQYYLCRFILFNCDLKIFACGDANRSTCGERTAAGAMSQFVSSTFDR